MALIVFGIPINLIENRNYDSSWTIGEWLISYAGGFARRGLPGSLMHWIAIHFNISPIYLAWLASVCFFILLTSLLWRLGRGRFAPSLLLSPIMLLGPIIGNYLVRKDVMLLALFGFCLVVAKSLIAGRKILLAGVSTSQLSFNCCNLKP
ncbi:hypothetical protein [Synechococcus sp. CBW1107]|uniref:hypothetical protein n=1 Tax=Synechococcus sp. CBW1107 TaxID=2789857 RepID=UPI002AD21297|nr:hypothetical protein [Synechococcus sp. CBW1107]